MTKEKFRNYFKNNLLIKLFFLHSLPMGFLAGLKVKYIDDEKCEITVRHRWVNKNPFKSMYFAVQAMAAEMSTGLPLVVETRFSKPVVSTLVLKNSATFTKKAVGLITFTSLNGKLIIDSVKKAQSTGEAILIDTKTIGRDEKGDVVAEFIFTWTLKAKPNRR